MRVLVALSRGASSTACGEFFSSLGWEVECTDDPSMALRFLTFRRYDAVVADLQFDDWRCTAGLEIARAAKRRGRDPVVILLTTSLSDELTIGAHAAGADFVLPKPQRLDAVAACIAPRPAAAHGAVGDPR
jgi:DNA-binding response OmpR family regulator